MNTGDEYEKIAADRWGWQDPVSSGSHRSDLAQTDRLSREPVFALGVEYAGETTESKLTRTALKR